MLARAFPHPTVNVLPQPLAEAVLLPRLSTALARASRRLASVRWPLAMPARPCRVSLSQRAAAVPDDAMLRLPLQCFGARAELALDARSQQLLTGEADIAALPASLRGVLVADALGGLQHALTRRAGESWRWLASTEGDATRSEEPALQRLWFRLQPGDGGAPGEAGLAFDADAAWERIAALAAVPPATWPGPTRRMQDVWRLPLRLTLGRTVLPLTDLRQVRPGDIVAVVDWQGDGDVVMARLAAGCGVAWRVAINQSTVTVRDAEEAPMDTATAAASAALDPGAPERVAAAPPGIVPAPPDTLAVERLAQLDVALRFEIGGLAISLAELARVGPGYVLELGEPLTRCEVSILCQSSLLGKGELVAVGERLGVRVTAFAAGDDA